MKAKKLFSILLILTIALVSVVAVACHTTTEEPLVREPGSETGTYYCDAPDGEYLLNLFDGSKFVLNMAGEIKHGDFTVDEAQDNKFTLAVSETEQMTAVYEADTVKLTIGNDTYNFLRYHEYTVSFNSNGGTDIKPVKVINGRTISKPENPTKGEYRFLGWYQDPEFNSPQFAFDVTAISSSITLYAKWTASEATKTEYTIDFNLGYEATAPAAMQTMGSKLYEVENPTRDGYDFKGWWISTSNNGDELTYCYNEDTVFEQDTTLFALWEAKDVALAAPVVEVTSTGVSWNAGGAGATYSLAVTGPNGEEIRRIANTGVNSEAIDWNSEAAGKYTITVTTTVGANTSTATRVFVNKALNRVSLFSVMGSVLMYNEVPNAQRYLITIICGDDRHEHTLKDNDNYLAYDFTNCPMKEGGIVFVVTAEAEGFVSSISKEYIVNRALDKISADSIVLDEATGKLRWNSVQFATNYVISIKSGSTTYTETLGNKTTFDLKEYEAGEITVAVYATAKGYYSPEATTKKINKTTLATPKDIKVMGNELSWTAVSGATGYVVSIDGTTYEVTAANFDLSNTNWTIGSDHVVSIQAKKASSVSLWSEAMTVRYNEMYGTLKYSASTLSWRHAVGAAYYEIFINGVKVQTEVENEELTPELVDVMFTGVNKAEINLTRAGYNEIFVRAVFDEINYADSEIIEVFAYTVMLEGKGAEVEPQYKALGDKMNLPVPEQAGYNFEGWYNAVGGAKGNGAKYESYFFNETSDINLYADWTGKSYKVTYNAGDNAQDGFIAQESVVYGEQLTLSIPELKDPFNVFVGWYTQENGGGVRLTDELGRSIGAWSAAEDIDVYAYYLQAFEVSVNNKGNVIVYGSNGLKYVTEVTVPEKYYDKTVNEIGQDAFRYFDNLKKIRIPASIAASISYQSFEGCNGLEEIEIYGTDNNSKYYTKDGVLFYNDTNIVELVKYPAGRKDTSYTIPSDVTRIGMYAFQDTANLREVIIANSVVEIGQRAFTGSSNLRNVIFESGSKDLKIEKVAFENCVQIREITLPARLDQIDIVPNDTGVVGITENEGAFSGCTRLERILVESSSTKYFSIDGMLCRDDTLVYCPENKGGDIVINTPRINKIGDAAFMSAVKPFTLKLTNITKIGDAAFAYSAITSIDMGNTVTEVGISTFYEAFNLESVKLSALLTNVPNFFCYNCPKLAEINFGGVETIGQYGFWGARELTELDFSKVTSVGAGAFAMCQKLISVDFAKMQTIGEGAFEDCIAIAEVILPDSVTSLGNNAFRRCSAVTTVVIGSGITSIPGSAWDYYGSTFGYCTSLTSLTLGENVTSIGGRAFYYCPITSVILPDAVTSFDSSAFEGCPLTSFHLGSKVSYLSYSSFSSMGIEEFTIDPANTTYSDGRDGGGANVLIERSSKKLLYGFGKAVIPTDPEVCNQLGTNSFTYSKVKELVIPDNIDAINAGYIFVESSLEKLTIGKNVAVIVTTGWNSNFNSVYNLREIIVDPENPVYSDGSEWGGKNVIIERATMTVILGGGDAVIPEGVTSIGEKAFSGRKVLESLTIPNGVTKIGSNAFENAALYSIVLPDTVTEMGTYTFASNKNLSSVVLSNGLTVIPQGAFSSTGLVGVTIPTNVTTIDGYAFQNCDSLVSVAFGTGLTTFGSGVFQNCTSLLSVVIPDGVTTLTSDLFAGCESMKTVTLGKNVNSFNAANTFARCYSLTTINVVSSNTKYKGGSYLVEIKDNGDRALAMGLGMTVIPEDVTAISDYAYQSSSVTSVEIHDKVTAIGNYAFSSSNLVSIDMPDSVTSIGIYLFQNCYSLADVKLSNSLTTIPRYTFYYCSGLTSIVIPEGVTTIEDYAFYGCSSLTSITLPSTLTTIGNNAFYQCAFESITIPSGVTSLGSSVFSNCSKLTSIVIPDSVTSLGGSAFYGCSSLTSVKLSNGLTSLGGYTFDGCTALRKIEIPDSVQTLGGYMFGYSGTDIAEIIIGSGVTKIEYNAFGYCYAIQRVEFKGTVAEWQKIEIGEGYDYTQGGYVKTIGYKGDITCSDGVVHADGTVTMN